MRPLSARIVSVEVIKTNLYFPFIGSYEGGESKEEGEYTAIETIAMLRVTR